MSENLDLVRSIYAAWERGDFGSAEWAHPDMEYVHADGPDPDRWIGLTDVTKGLREFLSAWGDWWTSAEEFRELDDGRVAVLNRYSGRGKTSGVEVGQIRSSGAAVFRVQGGKVRSIVIYFDRARALADLGLQESVVSQENAAPDRLAALRKHFEAFTCGDFDEAMGIYSPDAVWDSSPLGTGVFAGREAIRGFYEDWRAAYEDSMIEIEEFRDLGNGVAYSVLLQSGRVRGSSGVLQMRYVVAAIWTNVLVKQATVYTDVHAGRSAAERLAHELG